MADHSGPPVIRLRGVRHNNLKGFDLDLPQHRLIVITGLSGSGKSSLAFDTLFAEGQRRYIETFTPYARQFFDRMDKPRVDAIEGIPPAIAIEQRNAVRTTRSTVGTMTEICDYMKVLWPQLASLHCRQCGRPVRREPAQTVWQSLSRPAEEGGWAARECLVTFAVPLSEKLSLADSLALIGRQGYQRVLLEGEPVRLEEAASSWAAAGSLSSPPEEAKPGPPSDRATNPAVITVVQDRLRLIPTHRARFVEACEQAYQFGKGHLQVWDLQPGPHLGAGTSAGPRTLRAGTCRSFSNRRHCAECDLNYPDPSSALFSFNHPVGACPKCKGFGRVIEIDYRLAIPDRSKSLAGGAVKPWQSGVSAECQQDLRKFCRARQIAMDVPFDELPDEHQRWVLEGDADYGTDEEHQWPRAWYGVKGYFRWLESKAYKMHVRVLLSRYRAYKTCPECGGQRLKPDALLYRLAWPTGPRKSRPLEPSEFKPPAPHQGLPAPLPGLTLADFYRLPVRDALALVDALGQHRAGSLATRRQRSHRAGTGAGTGSADPVELALNEVRARLGYLVEVGLGYLTLDRATRTLSGGETERVNLTTCLGSRLVNTLFVLDEPSVGLHARDTGRLIRILQRLRDRGNTVVVVEHDASIMRAADHLVDLGPGHGESGGQVVFEGSFRELLRAPDSLTGAYLAGRRKFPMRPRRPVPAATSLKLAGVTCHNLQGLAVEIPLSRFVVVTGVSGSGKSTLIREVLFPELRQRLQERRSATNDPAADPPADDEGALEPDLPAGPDAGNVRATVNGPPSLAGWEELDRVVMVDQSSLGRTPRSNPAVYIGAFDDIRELFAGSEAARERGLNASAFSFNSRQGQCERCRGAGFEKIEMQFLSDVFIRCPDCDGRRYRSHILECQITPSHPVSQERDARGVLVAAPGRREAPANSATSEARDRASWSIGNVLEASVDEALHWLRGFPDSRHARRAVGKLQLLQDTGLGYLRLGQPINTLSGGESQRLKLAAHLAEAVPHPEGNPSQAGQALRWPPSAARKGLRALPGESSVNLPRSADVSPQEATPAKERPCGLKPALLNGSWPRSRSKRSRSLPTDRPVKSPGLQPEDRVPGPGEIEPSEPGNIAGSTTPLTLFLFDEPTTGLHFEDVRVLIEVFQRLVDAGHSVVVIEHNLEVIQAADWIIDLGPEAGDEGGHVVVAGTPDQVETCAESRTGEALRTLALRAG